MTRQPYARQPGVAAIIHTNLPSTIAKIVKPTIWIRSISDPDMIGAIFTAKFVKVPKLPPARSTS